MLEHNAIFVAAVFMLAGLAKGVIGLGLPTISMGLLVLVMPPVQAAALLALPSLVTNVWQMAAGPSLKEVVQRLWPMMLGVCAGTWTGMDRTDCVRSPRRRRSISRGTTAPASGRWRIAP